MKHLKYFEHTWKGLDILPKLYDYVICYDMAGDKKLNAFLSENVGQIIEIAEKGDTSYPYQIKYDNMTINKTFDRPYFFQNGVRSFEISEIVYCLSSKEDVELYIATNKYNL